MSLYTWCYILAGIASICLLGIVLVDRYEARLERESRHEDLKPDNWGV